MLIAKTSNFYRYGFGEFVRKKTDVNACTAINVRRIFVGKKENFHKSPTSLCSGARVKRRIWHRRSPQKAPVPLNYLCTFNSNTGTSTSWRTLSTVAP